jgi:copper resistance protein D
VPVLYYASVTLHVLAAMLWLGGIFFLGVIAVPVFRSIEPPALRQRLFQALGRRFRRIGWWTIATLIVTGVVNLHYRGWLHWDGVLGSRAFWHTGVGHALGIKLLAVLMMLTMSGLHDFVHGPRAGRAMPGSPEALNMRRMAAQLARANALAVLVLVIAAVRLARGG